MDSFFVDRRGVDGDGKTNEDGVAVCGLYAALL